jgi:flavin-dependent dehydrogenase
VVIDATGLGRGLGEDSHSTTHAAAGARIGVGAELAAPDYPVAPGELRMVVTSVGYAGLVRVEGGALDVAAAVDAASLRGAAPEQVVAGILAEGGLPPLPEVTTHAWRGTPALTRIGEDVGADRLFRVGDAAGYVEPFTGEGIGWALGDGMAVAELASRALEGSPQDTLTEWRRYRAARWTTAERLCRALARTLRRPRTVALGVAALRAAPWLASPFVRRAARGPLRIASARSSRR